MSMAIKYRMQKKAKGGMCEHGEAMCQMCHGGKAMATGGSVEEDESGGEAPSSFEVDMPKISAPSSSAGSDEAKSNYDIGKAKRTSDAFKGALGFAEGGQISDDDMVMDIMRKRMSKGGQVANDSEPIADSEPAEFDDLVLDDDLEMHETGANSGDELGDAAEDEDQRDVVSQIMKSRKKKDRLPRPA